MKNDKNIGEQWYTAASLSGLPGLPGSLFGIMKKAEREIWAHRKREGRGGGKEYPLSALPIETRVALAARLVSTASATLPAASRTSSPVGPRPAEQSAPGSAFSSTPDARRALADLSAWQVEVGTARAAVLDEVARIAGSVGFRRADRLFVATARAAELPHAMMEIARVANARRGGNGRLISLSALTRWRGRARGAATPVERIARLAPRARGRTWSLTPDVTAVLAKYRQPNKPALAWCVKETARELQVPEAPLYARCRRELKKLPKQLFYVGRNSGAALKALQPFRRRDFHELAPNDIWIGDGHSAKLKIAHPETGSPFVPEVTVIMDVGCRDVVGWSVSLSENCLAVSDALRHGISRHGVPLVYYSDGGAGQTAKMLDAPLTGILPAMGIQHETGRPGNPQGRGAIERLWQTILIPLAKRFATYQGRGADRETLRKVSQDIDRQLRAARRSEVAVLPARLPAFAQFIAALEEEIERYNTTHRHRSLPRINGHEHATPADYRAAKSAGAEIVIPSREELATLFMPSLLRQAVRGEVRLWNGVYFHRDLMLIDGEQVRVHYDIHDASRVWVKKLSGEFIALATLDGNRAGYMPKPVIEQLREGRAARRMQRLESKMEGVREELAGATLKRAGPPLEPLDAAAPENVVALPLRPVGELDQEMYGDDDEKGTAAQA